MRTGLLLILTVIFPATLLAQPSAGVNAGDFLARPARFLRSSRFTARTVRWSSYWRRFTRYSCCHLGPETDASRG